MNKKLYLVALPGLKTGLKKQCLGQKEKERLLVNFGFLVFVEAKKYWDLFFSQQAPI